MFYFVSFARFVLHQLLLHSYINFLILRTCNPIQENIPGVCKSLYLFLNFTLKVIGYNISRTMHGNRGGDGNKWNNFEVFRTWNQSNRLDVRDEGFSYGMTGMKPR